MSVCVSECHRQRFITGRSGEVERNAAGWSDPRARSQTRLVPDKFSSTAELVL